jgi:hypothetical protein
MKTFNISTCKLTEHMFSSATVQNRSKVKVENYIKYMKELFIYRFSSNIPMYIPGYVLTSKKRIRTYFLFCKDQRRVITIIII